jgi:hypothetical protein
MYISGLVIPNNLVLYKQSYCAACVEKEFIGIVEQRRQVFTYNMCTVQEVIFGPYG